MNASNISRRQLLTAGVATAAVGAASVVTADQNSSSSGTTFTYCLNTSTIRGQKLPLDKEIEMAAKAGYTGIEPWIREINAYKEAGGKLSDLKKQLEDHGMTVESAIGFARWIVDDEKERAAGMEQAKRDMDLVAQIGGTRIAAPPTGATKEAGLDLFEVAKRYRALLELGEKTGVTPMVEVWGFSKNLSRLGESVFVAIESGHPDACLLPDIYHIYKGGSDFEGLKLLSAACIPVCHVNDYPDIPNDVIKDADRVYPGDGVAPVAHVLNLMSKPQSQMALSLELFNPTYWKQDAETVIKTGLAKMKAAVTEL